MQVQRRGIPTDERCRQRTGHGVDHMKEVDPPLAPFQILGVEFLVAVPNENRLLKELGSPHEEDEETLEKMQSSVVKARNAHLVMAFMLLIIGSLNWT